MKTGIKYLLIGCGAALGAAIRWLCEVYIGKAVSDPFAILCVNVVGCYIIALVSALATKQRISQEWNKFLTTGFCGGLTTFSSFASGMYDLITGGHTFIVLCYIFFNLVIGLCAVALGFYTILGKGTKQER